MRVHARNNKAITVNGLALEDIEKFIYVSRKTKIRLYKTLVKPVLMYDCETWKMSECDAKKIDVFQNRCLRRIIKIKWQSKISNRKGLTWRG